ncbi:MAG: LptF/LptG family permease [Bacteroidales bacterium]|jgi:lipopolysaccharide export system permease protein|nr:LptF/LptG family permease [Bacteroidales bacterium]
MKKIHKLTVKSFIGPLLVTFCITMLILIMQFLWKYVDDLVGKGLDPLIIFKFLGYTALTLVPMALPITVLLASLMTLGNMGENYELVAIKSAGISLRKLLRPLFVFTIGISCLAFVFSNNVYPYAFLKYRTLLHDIQMKKPALNIKEGEYYKRIDGYVIRFDKKDRDGKTIHGVQIFDHTENLGNVRITMSKWGLMQTTSDGKFLVFTLYDGYSYAEDVKEYQNRHKRPFSRVKFEEQTIKFDLSSFAMGETDEGVFAYHEKQQNLTKLQATVDTLSMQYDKRVEEIKVGLVSRYHFYNLFYQDSNQGPRVELTDSLTSTYMNVAATNANSILNDVKYYATDLQNREAAVNSYEAEWYRKFTNSFACLLLFLVGAPLGAIIRKGGLGMPVVVSVLIFIAYFALSKIGEMSVLTTDLQTWKGMWLSAVIFLPIGIFLLVKATSDAAILDAEVWRRKFLKVLGRK